MSFVRPPGFDDLTQQEFCARVLEKVQIVEENLAAERRRTGERVLGRKAVLAQDWRDQPVSPEASGELNPTVAARSKWSRIEALLRNRAFRNAYAEARDALVAGIRDAVFPAGTYWLRRFTHASCAPLPAPS